MVGGDVTVVGGDVTVVGGDVTVLVIGGEVIVAVTGGVVTVVGGDVTVLVIAGTVVTTVTGRGAGAVTVTTLKVGTICVVVFTIVDTTVFAGIVTVSAPIPHPVNTTTRTRTIAIKPQISFFMFSLFYPPAFY